MARPGYAAAALVLYVASLFLAGARWRGFVRTLGGDTSVMRATLATLGGIAAGNLTPAPGGEVCRIALLRRRGHATWQQATIAAVWDRLSEVPPIVVLSVMAAVGLRSVVVASRAATIVVGAALMVVASVGLWRLRHGNSTLARWRDRVAAARVGAAVFLAGIGYSTLLWLQDVFRLVCATRAFGLTFSPTQIAMLSIVAMLGGLVPAVAGLGPIEGGLIATLMAFGVDLPTAAAVTALERAISYGFSTSAGAIVIAMLGGRSLWTMVRNRPGDASKRTHDR